MLNVATMQKHLGDFLLAYFSLSDSESSSYNLSTQKGVFKEIVLADLMSLQEFIVTK